MLYGVSTLLYLLYFYRKSTPIKKAATTTLLITGILHLGLIISMGVVAHRHPMATIFEFLSFIAMTMSFIYLYMEHLHHNGYIGAFVVPAILGLELCAAIGIQPDAALTPLLAEVHFALHATAFAAAYAAFFLGVLFAVMVILFERSVRQHHFGILFEQLPPLNILARMTAGTLLIGFIFMSVGLGLGTWTAIHAPKALHIDAKVILTVVIWLFYGFAIFSRFVLRWSDKSTAVFSIVGFLVLVLTTIVSHVTFSSWHNFVG